MNKRRSDDEIQKLADKVSDKAWKEDYPLEVERALHAIRQHDLVGVMIAQAMKRGEFDNLEGAGKPLNMDDNPFAADEMHLAYKILKDNGYAPYWIELGKEVETLRIKFNKEVDDFQKYTRIIFSERRGSATIRRYDLKKNNFYNQCRERLEEISKKILDYNLNCPVSLGQTNFDIDDEMSRIVKDTEKLIEDLKGLPPL